MTELIEKMIGLMKNDDDTFSLFCGVGSALASKADRILIYD
jgi:hypothetical protein